MDAGLLWRVTDRTQSPRSCSRARAADGEEDRSGVAGACEHHRPTVAERGDGIANRLAHRNREHQRRFAHGLAAEDDAGLRGALQKSRR